MTCDRAPCVRAHERLACRRSSRRRRRGSRARRRLAARDPRGRVRAGRVRSSTGTTIVTAPGRDAMRLRAAKRWDRPPRRGTYVRSYAWRAPLGQCGDQIEESVHGHLTFRLGGRGDRRLRTLDLCSVTDVGRRSPSCCCTASPQARASFWLVRPHFSSSAVTMSSSLRLPRHGHANRLTNEMEALTARRNWPPSEARPPGTHGRSASARSSSASRSAGSSRRTSPSTRTIDRVVAIAPFLGVSWLFPQWMPRAARIALRLPNQFLVVESRRTRASEARTTGIRATRRMRSPRPTGSRTTSSRTSLTIAAPGGQDGPRRERPRAYRQ